MADGLITLAARQRYARANINRTISPADGGMSSPTDKDVAHYWSDGASAMDMIFKAMMLGDVQDIESILDFPSGYGRILRHLKAAFPAATLTASDVDAHANSFCAETFGCSTLGSQPNLDAVQFERHFDLIWCGSLLTHLPEHRFRQCLSLFSRSLAPNGLAVFTIHGRYSSEFGRDNFLPLARWLPVAAAYRERGFGYGDYRDEVSGMTNEYGITLSSPSFVMACLEPDPSLRVLGFVERGWNDHQDVVIVQKRPLF